MKRRFLCQVASCILAIFMIIQICPSTSVYAMQGITPYDSKVESEEEKLPVTVKEKIDLLLSKLGVSDEKTSYFTVNQKACSSKRKSGHGCSNCNVENIVRASWFKDIFGAVDSSLFPPHNGTANSCFNSGQSCFGFACFAQWYVFADDSNEKLDGGRVATIKFTKSDIMENVKPGDVLRVNNSHSMLVYSVEEDGVVVVDSNWNMGSQLNCIVQKHLILYDSSYRGDVTYVNRVTKSHADRDLDESETVGVMSAYNQSEAEWVQDDDGNWYYIDINTGSKITGWVCSPESELWYYMDLEQGYMVENRWLCDPESGRWYYLGSNGAMCTSWIYVEDIWYYLDKNGAMCTGWNIIDDMWYLMESSGAMMTGWHEVGGKYYYMTENGDCLMNTTTPDGYSVDENGARVD